MYTLCNRHHPYHSFSCLPYNSPFHLTKHLLPSVFPVSAVALHNPIPLFLHSTCPLFGSNLSQIRFACRPIWACWHGKHFASLSGSWLSVEITGVSYGPSGKLYCRLDMTHNLKLCSWTKHSPNSSDAWKWSWKSRNCTMPLLGYWAWLAETVPLSRAHGHRCVIYQWARHGGIPLG